MSPGRVNPDAPFDASLVPPGLLAADLEAIAAEFGTPTFVYDEDEIRRRAREYVAAFGEGNVAYASKAFLCSALARIVDDEGLHLDCATGGELHVALHADFPAERIVLHGNNKSDEEIAAAIGAGVGRVVVDSFDEIDRIERLAPRAATEPVRVLVRVTPGVEAHTHEYIETGTEASKFGFTMTDGIARRAIERLHESDALSLVGLHFHIGSQISRVDAYTRAIDRIAELASSAHASGFSVGELNVGGGLGARYLAEDPELPVDDHAANLRRAVADAWRAFDLEAVPRVVVEPGRSIIAPSAITLYRVGTVKEVPGIGTYVAVDGGMSDNPRPVLYGAGYEAYFPRRITERRPRRGAVVGKHCEQGDVVVADAALPDIVEVGDLLATPTTGAYGYSMASNYNEVPRPAVVFVREGVPRLVVRRETPDDLVRLDVE